MTLVLSPPTFILLSLAFKEGEDQIEAVQVDAMGARACAALRKWDAMEQIPIHILEELALVLVVIRHSQRDHPATMALETPTDRSLKDLQATMMFGPMNRH